MTERMARLRMAMQVYRLSGYNPLSRLRWSLAHALRHRGMSHSPERLKPVTALSLTRTINPISNLIKGARNA